MKSLTRHAVIIGAQRAGSTSLYKMLKTHPDVYSAGPDRPEPKYFLRKDISTQEYLNSFFSDVTKHDQLLLEKSTSYYENPNIPQRIDELLKNVKILMIVRNPIDRAISNYKFSRDNGLEKRTLKEVFLGGKALLESDFNTSVNPFDYLGRSNYAKHVQPFLTTFGNRFRVIVLEELSHFEKRKEIFDFLEISENSVAPFKAENQAKELVVEKDVQNELKAFFKPGVEALSHILNRDFNCWDI